MENNDLNDNKENNIELNNLETENNIEENTINKSELEKKDKKNNLLIIVIVAILLVLVGVYFALTKIFVKEDNIVKQDNKNAIEEKPEETKVEEEKKQDEELLNYTLKVYKYNSGGICPEYNKDYCKDLAFTIKTKTENAKLIKGVDAFILYEDDGLKVYNNYDGKITKLLNLENQYKNYDIFYKDQTVLGIVYYTTDENWCKYVLSGYYNIKNNKKMYDNKYAYINYLYNSSYLTAALGDKIYLLNIDTEKEELSVRQSYNYDGEICYVMGSNRFNSYSNNSKNFYYITDSDVFNAYKFYSNDKKLIFDKNVNEGNWSFKDKYLYVVDDKVIKKYDIDGTLMYTSKTFENVLGILENYAVYLEKGNLSLKNVDNDKSVVLGKWNESYRYDNWAVSGVYSRERLDNMGEKDKPEGVYVVIYYKEKDASGNYGMEYCYTKTGEVKTFAVTHPEGGRAKPVLYLYPTKTTKVKVEFAHPEYLTTTYPKYNKSWEVKAEPNGDLYDSNNKYYYGLYWDEIRYNEVDFHEGFYVTKDKAIDFLEEKLDIIGFNQRERNEFIMYWLPILENNEKSIVYFELTKERERGNKLIITPKPDSMLRVSIHIKKVDKKINIQEQKLEKFNRIGFNVIEWGGMMY